MVAESVLVKQQLLILNRSRQRSPNLRTSDRLVAGLCALLIRPARLILCVVKMAVTRKRRAFPSFTALSRAYSSWRDVVPLGFFLESFDPPGRLDFDCVRSNSAGGGDSMESHSLQAADCQR